MSVIGGSIGVSPDQILASGDSFTAELANQPFAVQNLTYDAASSGTITVTVGVGRIEWSDLQLDQFTSNQTQTQTGADSLGGNTYYVILNKGSVAGTPTITIESSIPTQSDTGKLMLASYTLPATVSSASNSILVDKRPQISKGGGGGLLSKDDTNITINDTGSGSSIVHTIDGSTHLTSSANKMKLVGMYTVDNQTLSSDLTITSTETAFTGGVLTVASSVTLTVVGTLIIF